jgi:hypothetical protein
MTWRQSEIGCRLARETFPSEVKRIDGELKVNKTRIDAVHGRIDDVERSISESEERAKSFRS